MIKKLTNIIVDCEASGPCPLQGDLIEFAAVAETGEEFKSDKFPPLFVNYSDGAYQALGITRDIHKGYTGDFAKEAKRFKEWLGPNRQCMWSDNPAFDWQWINWLMHTYTGDNPFGFSARRIGDLYAGYTLDIGQQNNWKRFRVTKHTHDPLDDARGNMEAFKKIKKLIKEEKMYNGTN